MQVRIKGNESMEFAKSLSGHDKDEIYLIKERDNKFVYLVNGSTRPLAVPKKKSIKHIQLIKHVPLEVEKVISGVVTDLEVKRAVKLYKSIIQ